VTDTEVRARSLPDLRTLAAYWPGWRDATCLLLLVLSTWYLAGQDGGRPYRAMLPVLAASVLVMIATYPLLTRTPGRLRWLALAWVAGALIALAFAEVRAGWVRPVAVTAIAVPVVLATLQILRRPWGQTALIAIVGLAGLRAWYWGALVWWAGGGSRGETAWMSLSWHNQSGTLMGALGVGSLGMALVRTGWPRIVATVAAALGLSAAWLSSSRGAILATGLGLVVVVAARARRPDRSTAALALAATLALAVLAVAGLGALYAQGGLRTDEGATLAPVTERGMDAGSNLRARAGHWKAASRMFVGAPLTGTGPGSYRWSSVPVYPDDANLTASAHNEPLEVLAEQGLLGGGAAVVAAYFGLAWLTLGAIRRAGRLETEISAAATATILSVHAVVDFDWAYPLLFALLVVAAAVLMSSRDGFLETSGSTTPDSVSESGTDFLSAGVFSTTCLLLAVSLSGSVVPAFSSSSPPWELDGRMLRANTVAATGDLVVAEEELATIRFWNPGAPRLPAVQLLLAHATGRYPAADLTSSIDPDTWRLGDQLQAVHQLLDAGHPEMASQVLTQVKPVIDRRRAWGVEAQAEEYASLTLTSAWMLDGCSEAEAVWPALRDWLSTFGPAEFDSSSGDPAWGSCQLD
jgi:hypothetical protein